MVAALTHGGGFLLLGSEPIPISLRLFGGLAVIIGLLEVCESDFSKGLADMVANEEASQNSYDRASKENEIEKVTKDWAMDSSPNLVM